MPTTAPSLAGLAEGPPSRFAPGERVFDEQDEADCLYEVVGGVVRTLHFGRNGGRTIYGFFVPGQIFGLESQSAHRCSAEAVGEAQVTRYRRARLENVALSDRAVATQLWAWLTWSGEQATARLVVMARGSAIQKIAHFLIEMARHDGASALLRLPMTRCDIGDYLGLSSETVSRAFTALRRRRLIAIEAGAIRLLRPEALRRLGAAFS